MELEKNIARIDEFVESIKKDGFGENEHEKILVLCNGIVVRAWFENNLTYFQMYDHNASGDVVTEDEDINFILKTQFIGWYCKYISKMIKDKENIFLPGMTMMYLNKERAYLVPSDPEHPFLCNKVLANGYLIIKAIKPLEMAGKTKFWTKS